MITISTALTSFCTADARSALACFERLAAEGHEPQIRFNDRALSADELRVRADAQEAN